MHANDPAAETITLAVSTPTMLAGLALVAVSGEMGRELAGGALVIGGALALATGNWGVRFIAWGLPCLTVALAVAALR